MKVNNTDAASGEAGTAPALRRTQAQRTAATRARLVAAGRQLFADSGFADVTTEAIVAAAGVTRGALYHQFGNKAALFAAVHEEVERDLVAAVAERITAVQPSDAVQAMRVGSRLFLELCATPEVQQIMLVDAPAVLGWEQWRAVGMKYGLGIIEAMLAQAIAEGTAPEQPVRASAHVLLGALDEAALYISRATDPDQARDQMYDVCDRLLGGIAGRDITASDTPKGIRREHRSGQPRQHPADSPDAK
jgi:AcrR family transcriptional regulator